MKNILISFCAILFISCEKDIDFDLKNAEPAVVVDAQIENGTAPTVILTTSLDYFGAISPDILANSFIHNADISISNGTLTHKLKEYTVPLANGYSLSYYSTDSASLATAFVGEFDRRYNMVIRTGGKEYTASTSIPALRKVPDSLWFRNAPPNVDTSKRVLMTRVFDPPGLGNYIRYFTKRNSGNFLPGLNSAYSDEVVDGTTYSAQVDQGIDRNQPLPTGDENFFTRGDTVTFKLSNIDRASYTFWSTWEFSQQSIGNPFAQPGKVLGNISNGALGAFCGYANWFGTVIAR